MKRLADQTLYEILDVREDAPADEIEAACRRAVVLYGPGSLATYTLMTPDEAALLARRIDEARATLLDPAARARYDERRQGAPGEAMAAAGAATGVVSSFGSLPPVIPAAQPPPPPDASEETEEPEEAEPCEARPAILLASAVATAGSPADAPPPRPILLEREVPAAPEPPALPAAPPAAEPAPPPLQAPVLPEGSGWTGEALRQVREARGITVQQIADRTKVTRHHIENIEGERFGALPAPVYLRGILLSLARELRLDGQKVARSYLERAVAARSK